MKKYLLALLPFVGFWCGYYATSRIMRPASTVAVPRLIGMDVQVALRELAALQLHGRLVEERDDASYPEGTIISQSPGPEHALRPYQVIDFVVVKKREYLRAHAWIGSSYQEAETWCKKQDIPCAVVGVEHEQYPAGMVIAQDPVAGQDITQGVALYVAQQVRMRLMPTLVGMPLDEAVALLRRYGIEPTVVLHQQWGAGQVLAQRPYAGTALDITHIPEIQLMVG